MRAPPALLLALAVTSCTSTRNDVDDRLAVLSTLESWNRGWAEADASLAVEGYAEDAD